MTGSVEQVYGIVRVGQTCLGLAIEHLSEVCHINAVSEVPMQSDLLLGGFELRGNVVPLLNMATLCGAPDLSENSRLGAIVTCNGRALAFHIDEVIGIAPIPSHRVQQLSERSNQAASCFSGVFSDGDRFITLLDVAALFSWPGVHSATRPDSTANPDAATARRPMLMFESGGALFSVPAVEVYAAVPQQDIEVTAISSGGCLGEIRYHNRRVPVVNPVGVLGLGQWRETLTAQIVVLRFPDDQLLGLAVDAIRDLIPQRDDRHAALPSSGGSPVPISHVQLQPDGQDIYAIDVDQLRKTDSIAGIAALSAQPDQSNTVVQPGSARVNSNVIFERERYLVVQAGPRFAIPITQVSRILDPPGGITPSNPQNKGFRGYFSRLGESIALMDLCEVLGAGQLDSGTARVLLTGASGQQIGFQVEKVIGIEVAQWREKADQRSPGGTVVQLGTADNCFALSLIDLATLTSHLLPGDGIGLRD